MNPSDSALIRKLYESTMQLSLRGDWPAVRAQCERDPGVLLNNGPLSHLYGLALLRTGQKGEALAALRRAAVLAPGDAQIHYNLAVACGQLDHPGEATIQYRHCLRLVPTHRDALWNYGEILRLSDHFAQAVRCFESIRSQGAHYDWLDYRLAVAYLGCGDIEGSRVAFERELARVDPSLPQEHGPHPASALVHWEYAHLLLRMGEFERGFRSYEHRFEAGDRTGVTCATFTLPRWQGEPLASKRLLVHGEQGLGDQIMFASLMPSLLREIGPSGELVLAVSPPLVRLFSLAWPDVKVVPHALWSTSEPMKSPVEGLDLESPICSLARWRMPPGPERLTRQPPYLRVAAQDRALVRSYLAALVPNVAQTLKVGVMWGSNPAKWNPKASVRATKKSIPLTALAPLGDIPGITWVSLQNSDLAIDVANSLFDLVDCHPLLTDMARTAALAAEMDVVVCVDTSVAHLAAALGLAPVVLLMEHADWRWGATAEQGCAWYGSLTQLRQIRQGDWAPVVERLRVLLLPRVIQHMEKLGNLQAAADVARTLSDCVPHDVSFTVHALRTAINVCDWRWRELFVQRIQALVSEGRIAMGETLLTCEFFDNSVQRACMERAARAQQRKVGGALANSTPRKQTRSKRLRIGFLGGDFYSQATAYLMVGLLELHDREHLEFHAYDWGPDDGSPLRRRCLEGLDFHVAIAGMDNEAIARRIAADGVDVLLFLKGPYDPHVGVLAWRCAPVQVAYLYYPGHFGPLVDYLVADEVVVPAEDESRYGERIARLPRCYQPHDPQRPQVRKASRADCGLREDAIVLASFNQPYKLTPQTLDLWCEIVRSTPESVLWLLAPHNDMRGNLERELCARGLDSSQYVLARTAGIVEHLSRLACADLVLDTWPYGGHTGTSDALWAGVPVLTRMGEVFASRVAGSLLHSVGLDELVCRTQAEYLEIATRYVQDASWRDSLRSRLANAYNDRASLFDIVGYTRDFEALLTRLADSASSCES